VVKITEILAGIVNYVRFVGFKEQLGFFEYCYELALADHAKKSFLKRSVRPFFTKMCVFWAKHKIFKLDVEDFPTIQKFFFCSKVLEGLKYAKKWGYQANFEKGCFSNHPTAQAITPRGTPQ
jgi:hypothetical protein